MKLPCDVKAILASKRKAGYRTKSNEHEAIVRDCVDQIPANWLDPLLTGPNKVVKNVDCRQVEALLSAVKRRILARYSLEPKS